MTLLINPTTEPTPIFRASNILRLLTKNSARKAPRNGPIRIPITGMGIRKGPISKPIVLPHIPAFDPPNFLIPTRLATKSAPNNNRINDP